LPLTAVASKLAVRPEQPLVRMLAGMAFGADVEFSSQRFADVVVAVPVGPIDHAHAEPLRHALAPILEQPAATRRALVLDLADVAYISSMGLRVLMMAAKHLRGQNARIAVAALQPVVDEIFSIARFNHVVEVFPSVGAALATLSPDAAAAYDMAGRSGP